MSFIKGLHRWLCIVSLGIMGAGALRAQGVMSLSLTIAPDTVVQYGDSVKFTVRVSYNHPSATPFFGWVSFKYQTPLGVFDSITPVPSSYLIVGSGGFVNTTFYIPVSPSAFISGGGGNPIVIWPVLYPDTSITQGSVVVEDSVKATIYILPLAHSALSEAGLHLYPNPFSDYLFLKCEGMGRAYMITVHDAMGRLTYSSQIRDGENVMLKTDHWPEGLLVFRITSAEGVDLFRKILCKRD